eukprot:587363-Pyramimonas_sp.AAC.2
MRATGEGQGRRSRCSPGPFCVGRRAIRYRRGAVPQRTRAAALGNSAWENTPWARDRAAARAAAWQPWATVLGKIRYGREAGPPRALGHPD